MDEQGDEVPTASVGVWIGLCIIAIISFWSQATVTEDRFVPALNVIADYFRIPDDIAGATLMAAGASSPELFSSIVSLFITHSALGLGTIVGSEIFNQLIICAGAVFASKTGNLKLDPKVVTREVGFYALSILFLYIALHDRRPVDYDESGEDHIFINFWDSLLLFGGYVLYVIVCANMETIVACFTKAQDTLLPEEEKVPNYGTAATSRYSKHSVIDVPTLPFFRQNLVGEPKANFADKTEELFQTRSGEQYSDGSDVGGSGLGFAFSDMRESLRKFSDGASLRKFKFFVHTEKPSDEHGLYDVETNTYFERLSCFLWQRSYFYSKARVAKRGWHLRWFSFTLEGISSVPDRTNYMSHCMTYPKFNQFEIDEDRCILRFPGPKRDYLVMAPSKEILRAVTKKLEEILAHQDIKGLLPATSSSVAPAAAGAATTTTTTTTTQQQTILEEQQRQASMVDSRISVATDVTDSDEHYSLLEYPVDGNFFGFFFYLILFPLRFAMHYTIPDVRELDCEGNPTHTLGYAFCSVISCLIWLIVGSYAMVASLEHLAALLDIPDAVVGVTVSAVGTSLPNYVASKVAAQNGFGNMAVSNAFGSNTFNIMIGLGLPWVLYTSFGTNFQPYHELRDDGITQSVIILSIVLLIFIILVIPSGFVIYSWHGYVFILLYIAYLVFAIGQVYW